jgi:hypothetical protein
VGAPCDTACGAVQTSISSLVLTATRAYAMHDRAQVEALKDAEAKRERREDIAVIRPEVVGQVVHADVARASV